MTRKFGLALLAAGCAFAFGPLAHAEPGDPAVEQPPLSLASPETPLMDDNPFGGTGPIDEKALRAVSGMASLEQYASANNSSVVAGNSVNGQSVTGGISIDGKAFHDLHGLSILTANTGNNVSINAAMNVNVSIQQ